MGLNHGMTHHAGDTVACTARRSSTVDRMHKTWQRAQRNAARTAQQTPHYTADSAYRAAASNDAEVVLTTYGQLRRDAGKIAQLPFHVS